MTPQQNATPPSAEIEKGESVHEDIYAQYYKSAPAPEPEPVPNTESVYEPVPETEQPVYAAASAYEPEPVYEQPAAGGYIDGTCAALRRMGMGNFYPDDPNYTNKRDRDKDGIACEL